MNLFKITTNNNLSYNIMADNEQQAIEAVKERYGAETAQCILIENPAQIPLDDFNNFTIQFHNGLFKGQRIGQAFINHFKNYDMVDALSYGGYLWEEKNIEAFYHKVIPSNLIDFS